MRIGCVLDNSNPEALSAFKKLQSLYAAVNIEQNLDFDCDVVVTLGGDGIMLKALHKFMDRRIPFFGMNKGSIGFLLNNYKAEGLLERIQNSSISELYPLSAVITDIDGEEHQHLAINEVSLMRETQQSAKINIIINDSPRLHNLVADGVLLSTPAGSSAYNYAVGGPIVPINGNVMSLRAISPFRPRNWRGALVLRSDVVKFEVVEGEKRPVSVSADSIEIRGARSVEIHENNDLKMSILFDPEERLEERAAKEQFI